MIQIAALRVYPVKSCAGIDLKEAMLNASGIVFDRNWAVVSQQKGTLTQREIPKMAQILTALTDSHLVLSAPLQSDLLVSLSLPKAPCWVNFKVWEDEVSGHDEGEAASAWINHFLGQTDLKLVRCMPSHLRHFEPRGDAPGGQIAFADSRPLLVIGEQSLWDLNKRLETPLSMDRFRPNIVLSGSSPYAEDDWQSIQIDDVEFYGSKSCTRCVITTVDQTTGQKSGKEPLKALSQYRKGPKGVHFGRYFVPKGPATLQIGARVGAFYGKQELL